ncbi:MAG: DUF4336 domain-containing protein [Sphingomonas sp.]
MVNVTYSPTDTLKPVADDIWTVDSGPIKAMGMALPVRMTVVRLPGGDLWLHSPTRCEPRLLRALQQLGTVRHLVAPSIAHWTMVHDWQRACPGAVTWAAPGLAKRPQVRASGMRIDHDLGEEAPPAWRDVVSPAIVPGAFGYRELIFFHRPSRTLVLTDLVQNLEPAKLPRGWRLLLRLAGSTAPEGGTPVYLRLVIRPRRREAATAIRAMLAMAPERVIFSHGALYDAPVEPQLRRALAWLLG